jgi:chemotaxis protein CheD
MRSPEKNWAAGHTDRRARVRHALPIGRVFAGRDPVIIKAVLGSAIAVCLFDPETRVGGMSHFTLPSRLDRDGSFRGNYYGVYAMDLLINEVMKHGAERRRLNAKVSGAARLLPMDVGVGSVSMQNAAFITSYLKTERIPLLSQDLGGDRPRVIYFDLETGRLLVKHLGPDAVRPIAIEERRYEGRFVRALEELDGGDVTLFQDDGQ